MISQPWTRHFALPRVQWGRWEPLASYLLLLAAGAVVLFRQLSVLSLRMWDESRLAVSALEMLQNHDWLVVHFGGRPEMWSVKPPLMIWCIAASMQLFGYSEFGLRLPAVLATLATLSLVFWFCRRWFGQWQVALVAGAVLITSNGLVGEHVGRFGEYDALLVFWMSVVALACFAWSQSGRPFWIWLAAVALVLGILTKSVAALMGLPALFLFVLLRRQLGRLFTNPHFYAAAFAVVGLAASYYLLREQAGPGYLQAVWTNELGGRYLSAQDGATQPLGFYFKQLLLVKYVPWVYVLPLCLLCAWCSVRPLHRQFGLFGFLYISTFLVLITVAKTKHDWYDAPIYPVAAIAVAIGLVEIFEAILSHLRQASPDSYRLRQWLVISLAVVSLLMVYRRTLYETTPRPDKDPPQLRYGYYFKELARTRPQIKHFTVIGSPDGTYTDTNSQAYNSPLYFYVQAANRNGYRIRLAGLQETFAANDLVVSCNLKVRDALARRFTLLAEHADQGCETLRIGAVRINQEPLL